MCRWTSSPTSTRATVTPRASPARRISTRCAAALAAASLAAAALGAASLAAAALGAASLAAAALAAAALAAASLAAATPSPLPYPPPVRPSTRRHPAYRRPRLPTLTMRPP